MKQLEKEAVKDAVMKALNSRHRKLYALGAGFMTVYEIDDDLFTEERAVDVILQEYSWWK